MAEYQHFFRAPIEKHPMGGGMYYTVVFVPPDVLEGLPLKEYPRLRIEGLVADRPVKAALQPVRGRWYLMTPKTLMRKAGVEVGQEIEVRFRVADQTAVEVPEELQVALTEDPRAKQAWDEATPGRKRGLAHRVDSAKSPDVRARRAVEALDELIRPGSRWKRKSP